MHDLILESLLDLEREDDVRIIYACESGSRAWGFPSVDSDYDVRFLYVHSLDWYFSIDVERKDDVIERPIEGKLDISGWDLRKALKLFRKSNPPLLEWISSPVVYLERIAAREKLKRLLPDYYSPAACAYHYLNMARNNYKEYLTREEVWVKKYFYVLRPLLAIRWIEQQRGIVPMEFGELMATISDRRSLTLAINSLLERKKGGEELDRGPRIPEISDFIDSEIDRLEKMKVDAGAPPAAVLERLDSVFRNMVNESWGLPAKA